MCPPSPSFPVPNLYHPWFLWVCACSGGWVETVYVWVAHTGIQGHGCDCDSGRPHWKGAESASATGGPWACLITQQQGHPAQDWWRAGWLDVLRISLEFWAESLLLASSTANLLRKGQELHSLIIVFYWLTNTLQKRQQHNISPATAAWINQNVMQTRHAVLWVTGYWLSSFLQWKL